MKKITQSEVLETIDSANTVLVWRDHVAYIMACRILDSVADRAEIDELTCDGTRNNEILMMTLSRRQQIVNMALSSGVCPAGATPEYIHTLSVDKNTSVKHYFTEDGRIIAIEYPLCIDRESSCKSLFIYFNWSYNKTKTYSPGITCNFRTGFRKGRFLYMNGDSRVTNLEDIPGILSADVTGLSLEDEEHTRKVVAGMVAQRKETARLLAEREVELAAARERVLYRKSLEKDCQGSGRVLDKGGCGQ